MVQYWKTYDWRKVEARLNALPQFVTEIDGLDIHFIHVVRNTANALPMIVTHGWPGSIIEQLKIIGPLTDPTAYGGKAADAFDVVIPSLPGYGFSGKPAATGWDPQRIARAWIVLMKRLGYTRLRGARRRLGQCGNRTDGTASRRRGCSAFTPTCRRTVPADDLEGAHGRHAAARRPLSRREARVRSAGNFLKHGLGYAQEMANRPQTLYGIEDSPIGLAAWMLDHDKDSRS